jgi:hypothetical protein
MTCPDALLATKRQHAELTRTISRLREEILALERALAEARTAAAERDLARVMDAIEVIEPSVARGREIAGIDEFVQKALRN